MKKLILLVSIFLASGCSKTLTCTNESKDNNSTQKSEVIIKFDGDKPTEMKTNIIFKTDSEENFNTYKKNFEKVLETMDIEGDISTGENEITLTFSEKYNDDAKIIDGTNDYKNIREYFSNNGYTSRRKAEELITKGKVRVNGIVAKLGDKANYTDTITIDGKVIEDMNENKIYILLNKPRGVVTTTSDEKNRKTVLDLIDIDKRVYPVGRLDYDTTGVLLLTNDGKLTNLLTHPSNKFNKTYVAKVKGFFTKDAKESLSRGVNLGSYISARAIVRMKEYNKKTDTSIVEVTIHEGKNHEVKNMFKALGYDVIKLKREKFGFLDTKGLKSGEYRYLSTKEVKKLYGNI